MVVIKVDYIFVKYTTLKYLFRVAVSAHRVLSYDDGANSPSSNGMVMKQSMPLRSNNDAEKDAENFIGYVIKSIQDSRALICDLQASDARYSPLCETISNYMEQGRAKYAKDMPPRYYANFLTMTIAYPSLRFIRLPSMYEQFYQAFRFHRALGYGNALRLLGYKEEDVQSAYWLHNKLIMEQDLNPPAAGDGIGAYCAYTNQEYEHLKNFARDSYNGSELPLFTFNATNLFESLCQDKGMGYMVRSDWEQHRREVLGSLMYSNYTRPIVLYTVFHWESLFQILANQTELGLGSFFKSFDVIAESCSLSESMSC